MPREAISRFSFEEVFGQSTQSSPDLQPEAPELLYGNPNYPEDNEQRTNSGRGEGKCQRHRKEKKNCNHGGGEFQRAAAL